MTTGDQATPHSDPGSFRDPRSRVLLVGDRVLRGLTREGAEDHAAVAATGLLDALQAEGALVATEVLDPDGASALGLGDDWAQVLGHERVPVISYPYEWSFEMLRDAALLQLEVTRRALAEGCTTKDATPYNVQFLGSRPTFIDVGSFEPLRAGEPWAGYRQFCQLFLNPLVVQAVAGVPFQPWLRGALAGIEPAEVAPLLRGRKRLDRHLAVHVSLHARTDRRHATRDVDGRQLEGEMRRAGLGPKVLAAQVDNLERTVRSLDWDVDTSTWSDYGDRAHYTDGDLAAKEAFVARAVEGTRPGTVLDLGANDGRFSHLAVERGAHRAVAVDSDALVVDRLYRRLRSQGEERILPLVIDLADPSPGLGWRGRERPAFVDRARPDLVLALAVVHHLALTDTAPFGHIVDLLADFGAPLVVELPHPDDPMAARLLARKRAGLFDHYRVDAWEEALAARFVVDEREVLPSGHRTLYRCRPR